MSSELRSSPLPGVFEIISKPFVDNRGTFLNAFRQQDLTYKNIWKSRDIAQINLSSTAHVGTVRGLHYQTAPHTEAKLVRCIRGCVWDVAVDLRRESPTFKQWYGLELSAELGNALMIPEGCAHGYQVIESNSELLYLHSSSWVPEAERGVRWNDPTIAIKWPLSVTVVSDRDSSLPNLEGLA